MRLSKILQNDITARGKVIKIGQPLQDLLILLRTCLHPQLYLLTPMAAGDSTSGQAKCLPKRGTNSILARWSPPPPAQQSENPTPTKSENCFTALRPGGSKEIGIMFAMTRAAMP